MSHRYPCTRARVRLTPLATALLAALPLTAVAQFRAVDPVIIEGQRSPSPAAAAPDAVGAEQLRRGRAATSDTAALLRDIPGVSLQGAGGASSLPAIHGMASDRLRIQVDGMDLIASCPNHMNPPLSYLDPSAVVALEVYAGLTPVSVGGDSIGGTIVARTREPVFAEPGQERVIRAEAGAFVRSNGNAQGFNASVSLATPALYLAYDGARARSDNLRAGADFKTGADTGRVGHTLPLDEIGSTAFDTRNHQLGLAHRRGSHLFEARLGWQDVPLQLYPNQRMDMLDNRQQRGNLRYTGRFGWGTLEARAYREEVQHLMDFGPDRRFWYGTLSGAGAPCDPIRFHGDPAGTCAAGMPMTTDSRNTGLTLQAELPWRERDLLRLGALAQAYRLEDLWPASGGGMGPGEFQNIHDGRRDRSALFGEWESRSPSGWKTSVGLRFEQVRTSAGPVHGYNSAANASGNQTADAAAFNAAERERRDHNWDFTALARYTVGPTLDVEGGVARKVRSPNLYERYSWSTWAMAATMNNFVGDGNGYVGDPALEPEKAHTVSATLDWHAADRSWTLKATPYLTLVSDYIDAVPGSGFLPNQFNVLRYANQSARITGLDLSGRMPLATTAWGSWGLEGLVNLTRGTNRDRGDELFNIMPPNGKLSLTHRLGRATHAIEVAGVAAKTRVSDVRNEIPTAGYGLAHLRASYRWQQWRLDLGVDNLFDRAYVLPTGGAYVGQGRTMSMNGVPWGVGVPGPGRSVYLGATVSY